jgi:DNA-binding IscR family transcriptional regulator
VKDKKLFKIHANSEPRCPIGRNITTLLDPVFSRAQSALEKDLNKSSLQDILNALNAKLQA